jgi:chromosome segregation ATPase
VAPEIWAALIGAGSLALGGIGGRITGRRQRSATVELTEAQADDLMTQTAERVVRMLSTRIKELEDEVRQLRGMIEDRERRERELVAQADQLRGERDALGVELTSLRAQLAAKEVELRAARQETAELRLLAVAPAAPPSV